MQGYLYNLATDKKKGFVAATIKAVLFLLSLVYGLVIRVLILFYRFRPRRFNCKVIGIGNITLGGTGKTVLVEYVARCLKEHGHKTAIITRGYKRNPTSYDSMGDEPFMLSKSLIDVPVIVDSDRVRAIDSAIKNYSIDTVILDDAFQQWKIKKDLEIVAIDVINPFGNRHMLPRGILREPLAGLKRADEFILTKTNINPDSEELIGYLKSINPAAGIFESRHKQTGFYKIGGDANLLPLDAFKGRRAVLFSGIGDPDSFTSLIEQLGIKVEAAFKSRDHYNYTQQDIESIIRKSQEERVDIIITTEKDAARLSDLKLTTCLPAGQAGNLQLLVLRIEIDLKDEQKFVDRLLSIYSL